MADTHPLLAGRPAIRTPRPARRPHTYEAHGHRRVDDYSWMADRDSPEVLDHLKAENAYVHEVLAPWAPLREALYTEMRARIRERDESVPERIGDYWYGARYDEGGEYPRHLRWPAGAPTETAPAPDAPEILLLDEALLAADEPYFDLGAYVPTDDGALIAYTVDTVSRRLYRLRVRRAGALEDLPGGPDIPNVDGDHIAFSADGQGIFYIERHPDTLLGYRVRRHQLGTDPSGKDDPILYQEPSDEYYLGLERDKTGRYLLINSHHNGIATEVQYIDLEADPAGLGPVRQALPRLRGHEYHLIPDGARGMLILSNAGGQAGFFVAQVPSLEGLDVAGHALWPRLVAHHPERLIEHVEAFETHTVVVYREQGLVRMDVYDRRPDAGGTVRPVTFDEPAYLATTMAGGYYPSPVLRYGYTSMTTPMSVYDMDLSTGERTLRRRQPVEGTFDPADYRTERLMLPSRDGRTQIPVSLVYRVGMGGPGQGGAMLQYAYGSYGHSMDAYFSSARLSLLDRGFTYALCHVRGGQELGRAWYEAARREGKPRTFEDYIDCAVWLRRAGYVAREGGLYAMGGSAGGLLMGAVANMAPVGLYEGIVAQVAFVDVVTTMLDTSIPLTTGEYEEWGNPNVPADYRAMLAWSPYDNVHERVYPAILATTGLHDSQVQYWEPAKWVARLRDHQQGTAPILLHTQLEAGHGGASGRFEALREVALEYAFLIALEGARPGGRLVTPASGG